MSDTPRTDAFERLHGKSESNDRAEFARTLERENAALKEQLAAVTTPQAEGWRGIDSAPRDGTRILLDCGWPARWVEHFYDAREEKTYPTWVVYDCEDPWYSLIEEKPTHWIPLPDAPDQGEK